MRDGRSVSKNAIEAIIVLDCGVSFVVTFGRRNHAKRRTIGRRVHRRNTEKIVGFDETWLFFCPGLAQSNLIIINYN